MVSFIAAAPCFGSLTFATRPFLAADKKKDDSGSDNDVNEDNNDEDHLGTEPDSEDEQVDVQPRVSTRGTRGKRGRGGTRSTGTRRKKAAAAGDDLEDGAKLARDAKISDDNPLFSQCLLSQIPIYSNSVYRSYLEPYDRSSGHG